MGSQEWREGKHQCPKCGIEYTLYSTKWPDRDPGRVRCKCGTVLMSWSGSRTYGVRFSDGCEGEEEYGPAKKAD